MDKLKKTGKRRSKNFESAEKLTLKLPAKNVESDNAILLLETENNCPSDKK